MIARLTGDADRDLRVDLVRRHRPRLEQRHAQARGRGRIGERAIECRHLALGRQTILQSAQPRFQLGDFTAEFHEVGQDRAVLCDLALECGELGAQLIDDGDLRLQKSHVGDTDEDQQPHDARDELLRGRRVDDGIEEGR